MMIKIFKITIPFTALLVIVFFFTGAGKNKKFILSTDTDRISTIRFDPDRAIDIPFDSLFRSVKIIELQWIDNSTIKYLMSIARTDSFLLTTDGYNYRIFNLNGQLRNKVGSSGDGPNSNRSLGFYYAFNNSVISISGTKWIKYGFNGKVLGKGQTPYKMYPNSFIPLNDSTWLFYKPHLSQSEDTIRLWTTNNNFKIKKIYLSFGPKYPTGIMGFTKFIYQTGNGIYITDRVVDTIYRFEEKGVNPVYVFDYSPYKYYRTLEIRNFEFNELGCGMKIVTTDAVLFKVKMNNIRYFIYYNRKTNTSKTIRNIIDGPDLINSWELKGVDKYDRQYWSLSNGHDTLINSAAIKFKYADFLFKRKVPFYQANPIIAITTLR